MPRHVVKPGDTIKTIVKKYNVTLQNLLLANNHLENLDRLNPGEVIHIPDSTDGALGTLEVRTLKPQLLTMLGFSTRQVQEHYKLYQGYINFLNEVRIKLRTLEPVNLNSVSHFTTLKLTETKLVSNYKLHEIYFENLGGKGGSATGSILESIVRNFGSFEAWLKDFQATGLVCDGWTILGYDYDDGRLHNYIQDSSHLVPVRFEPLLVMDVNEHAYFLDYGTNRKSYIDAFLRNIDWAAVNSRYNCVNHTLE